MLFWREGGISVERYTNPDCKPEMEELMKDCPRSRSGAECWLRLCDIEDILGDNYDLDRLCELGQADRDGRCVVLPCKVEDDVYINILGRTLPFTVISISQMASIPTFKAQHGIRLVYIFKADDVGETVFLTRAEAEAALRREQDD